jgi:hypothetical protein
VFSTGFEGRPLPLAPKARDERETGSVRET